MALASRLLYASQTARAVAAGERTPAYMPTSPTTAEEEIAAVVLPIVGVNIVNRRERLGMSQRALSIAASVDRPYLAMVERGRRTPTVVFLAKLAAALDTSVSALTKGI